MSLKQLRWFTQWICEQTNNNTPTINLWVNQLKTLPLHYLITSKEIKQILDILNIMETLMSARTLQSGQVTAFLFIVLPL